MLTLCNIYVTALAFGLLLGKELTKWVIHFKMRCYLFFLNCLILSSQNSLKFPKCKHIRQIYSLHFYTLPLLIYYELFCTDFFASSYNPPSKPHVEHVSVIQQRYPDDPLNILDKPIRPKDGAYNTSPASCHSPPRPGGKYIFCSLE